MRTSIARATALVIGLMLAGAPAPTHAQKRSPAVDRSSRVSARASKQPMAAEEATSGSPEYPKPGVADTLEPVASTGTMPGAGKAKMQGVAVLEIRPLGTVDKRAVAGVAGLIASEMTRASEQTHVPLRVIAGSDFTALVGYEKQRALMGCTDTACLAEIAGALGVEYLVSSEVSIVGGVWLLSSTLLDTRKATAVTRTTKKIKALSDMPDAASEVATQLMSAMPLSKAVEAPAAAAVAAVALPEARLRDSVVETSTLVVETQVGAASAASKRRTLAYALGGGGALFLGAGLTFNVLARNEFTKAQGLQHDPSGTAAMDAAKAAVIRNRALGWIGYGVGAAAVGLGTYFALTSGSQRAGAPAPSVGVVPLHGGGLLVLEGGF